MLELLIVTFLHLAIGEMAPKSWAITHPETSATLLAIPMRAFMWLTRPVLRALNQMANWMLRNVGVEPADQLATGQNPDDLRHLVEGAVASARVLVPLVRDCADSILHDAGLVHRSRQLPDVTLRTAQYRRHPGGIPPKPRQQRFAHATLPHA